METGGQPAALVQGVSQTYPNGIAALSDVSVSIPRGAITAIIGGNGSGKTTLLKILAGLLTPQTGAAEIFGENANAPSKTRRSRLGYVSQAPELDPEMTGFETLALFGVLFAVPAGRRRARAQEVAADFGLTEHLARPVAEYSGGLRQRLHLALAWLHEPELLLLDEPTAALDPAGRAFVWDRLRSERSQGRAVAIVTHDLPDAAQHCQSVVLLQRGSVVATGAPDALIAAHGSWNLRLEWQTPMNGDSPIPAQLAAVAGVKKIALQPDGARLDLAGSDATEVHATTDRVLDFLAREHVAVVSFRLHAPDLASAYFHLTDGASLDLNSSSGIEAVGGRAGRRRQEMEGPRT